MVGKRHLYKATSEEAINYERCVLKNLKSWIEKNAETHITDDD